MRGIVSGVILLVGAGVVPGYVAPVSAAAPRCHVINGAKLPPASGADLICAEIERAVAARAPRAHYTVTVTVRSPSRLSALAMVNGQPLPEQNFAVMDQELNPASVRRFAGALASEIAKVVKE